MQRWKAHHLHAVYFPLQTDTKQWRVSNGDQMKKMEKTLRAEGGTNKKSFSKAIIK